MEKKKTFLPRSIRSFFSSFLSPHSFFRRSNSQLGFTLVELLIVIGVLGIMASSLYVLIDPALQISKSRDSNRKADIKQIQAALELYRSDQGNYPNPNNNSVACNNGTLSDTCGAGANVVYMQNVPEDPKTGNHYYYCRGGCNAPSNGYYLYACLENSEDDDPNTVPNGPFNCSSGRYYRAVNP
jgi:general secretion pathway protein G